MVTEEFLVCRACGQLTPAGTASAGSLLDDGHDASDLDRFREVHRAHGLHVATRTPVPSVFDRPVWDPMAVVWFEVQIQRERFVVRSSRTSIDEPRIWEITRAVIERRPGAVELDEEYLRLALDRWFYPHVLPSRVSDRFLAVLEDVTRTLDPDQLESTYDDSDDPEVSIAPLPISARERLLQRTQAFLDDVERQRFAGFVSAHSGADGALAVHVRRPFVVRPR
jgi:hypothetical protein